VVNELELVLPDRERQCITPFLTTSVLSWTVHTQHPQTKTAQRRAVEVTIQMLTAVHASFWVQQDWYGQVLLLAVRTLIVVHSDCTGFNGRSRHSFLTI
jgi:hypothetical protein